MSDQMDELIKEIAAKHGIAVSRDDPISLADHQPSVDVRECSGAISSTGRIESRVGGLGVAMGEREAKEKANRILSASLAASKVAMTNVMDEGAKAASSSLRGEIEACLVCVAQSIGAARRISLFNVVASCLTLLATLVAFWATRL